MKLSATVTAVESGRNRSDGQQQIKIKVSGAEAGFNAIIVPNTDNLALDEELVVLVLNKHQALKLQMDLYELANESEFVFRSGEVLELLQPAPFMADAEMETTNVTATA